MNEIMGTGIWVRIAVIVIPLFTVLWADTVMERYWPGVAPAARTRWRHIQKRLIEPFLPLNADRAGPIWPLNGMVDTQRFLARPGTYLGRMAAFVFVCTAVHYWDRIRGLTALWAVSYVVGAFVMLIMIAGLEVWSRGVD